MKRPLMLKRQKALCLAASLLLAGGTMLASTGWAYSVTEADIAGPVLAHIRQAISSQAGEELSTEIITVPGAPYNFPTAASVEDVKIEATSNLSNVYSNRAIVRVTMTDPQGQAREIGVPVKIMIKKPVWVVQNRIDAGQALLLRDLKLEKREVGQIFKTAVGKDKDLNQYEARVNLQPGEILDARKINLPPAVRRNSEVRIILSNGQGMNIVIQGQSLEDGRIGQRIRVRNQIDPSKHYMAKVVAKNKVLIEM